MSLADKLGITKRAAFNPTRHDNVRPEIVDMVGVEATWQCTDFGGSDEQYPGQHRWFAVIDDGSSGVWKRLGERFKGFWVPDEDLSPKRRL